MDIIIIFVKEQAPHLKEFFRKKKTKDLNQRNVNVVTWSTNL